MNKVYKLFLLFQISMIPLFSQTVNEGLEHLNNNNYQSAIEIFESIIIANPDYIIAYNYLGYSYILSGDPSKAIDYYKISDNESPSIHSKMGLQWAYLLTSDYEKSIGYGKEALQIEPENYYALDRLGEAYLGQKKYESGKEIYKKAIQKHGKNADLLWKLGICEYYLGNSEKGISLFKEGKELNPEHKGILYSLGNSHSYPIWEFIPEYSIYSFTGSDFIGAGSKKGASVNLYLDQDWSFRIGYFVDQATNVNRTKGMENYILNEYNILQYSYYQTREQIYTYLNNSYNTYYLAQIANQSDYVINKYTSGVTHQFSDKFSVSFSPQYIKSNSKYIDGAGAAQIGYYYKESDFTLSATVSGISYPFHKGGQISISLYLPFWNHLLYTNSNLTGQVMGVTSYDTVLIYPNPVTTYQSKMIETKGYGFFQQEFGYNNGFFSFLVGGRIGSARTPMMNEYWITTPFTLMGGFYSGIGIYLGSFDFHFSYSLDQWKESNEVWSVSRQGKISITGRF